jgi:hypothetical protein
MHASWVAVGNQKQAMVCRVQLLQGYLRIQGYVTIFSQRSIIVKGENTQVHLIYLTRSRRSWQFTQSLA